MDRKVKHMYIISTVRQRWNRVVRVTGHRVAGSTFWAGSGVTGQCPIHMTRSFDPDSALQKCTFCLLVRCHCQRVGSSGTGFYGYQQFLSMFFVVVSCRIAKPLLCCIHMQ